MARELALEQGAVYIPVRLQPFFTPFVPIGMEVKPGVNLLIDPDDFVARSVVDSGQWEKESWDVMERYLPAEARLWTWAHMLATTR